MSDLKVTYFDIRGRVEPIRLALVISHLPFTDDRFPYEEFSTRKLEAPYKAFPTMHIDGSVYAQSGALLRYVGKKTGLYPSDDLEALKCDEIADTTVDMFAAMYRYMGKDEDRKKEEREKMVREDLPKFMGGIEKRMATFSGGPFVLGEKVSVADLTIVNVVNTFKCGILDYVDPGALDGFERVIRAYDAVMAMEEVVEWYGKHPIPNVTK